MKNACNPTYVSMKVYKDRSYTDEFFCPYCKDRTYINRQLNGKMYIFHSKEKRKRCETPKENSGQKNS